MNTSERFDPDGCVCDAEAKAGGLIPFETAVSMALDLALPVRETEWLPIEQATDRVLAGPVSAPAALPMFDSSAMDGYALRTRDLTGDGPWTLPVSGRTAAGDPADAGFARGTALRILTGAAVASEADAVVTQEAVDVRAGRIILRRRPDPGSNIRRRGEDLCRGDDVLPAGIAIGPRQACALAYCGAAEIEVRRKVRVAVFSTGSELRPPGAALGPGQIWNCNLSMLTAALTQSWVEVVDLGAIPDRPDELAETLAAALGQSADLIISTGGVSVGDEDHMRGVVCRAGGEIAALRIAMKPGKPVAVGRIGAAVFVGLPGNPVAAFVAWHMLGAPVLKRLGGIAAPRERLSRVRLGSGLSRFPGRCEFRPARILGRDPGGLDIVGLLSSSFSARVGLLAAADGLAVIPADAGRVPEGELLDFIRF